MSLPAVVVTAAEGAAAALRLAGRPLLLLSAEGAGGFLGPRGWRALITRIAAHAPAAPFEDALCCGDAPGRALAALRAGCRIVVLDGAAPAFPAVAEAARAAGATLLPARPPALDLRTLDLRRDAARAHFRRWLAAHPHDSAATQG